MLSGMVHRTSVGQFREFAGMVLRCLPDDLGTELTQSWIDNPDALRSALRGALKSDGIDNHVVDLDADPFVPERWTVEEHIKGGQFEWDPAKVALYLSENQQGGKQIRGHELREELKLKRKAPFNANLLDYLLAHPDLIPEEWKGRFVPFWGTIYRYPDGHLYVRCLRRSGSWWHWHFYWLAYDFIGSHPAAVPASI